MTDETPDDVPDHALAPLDPVERVALAGTALVFLGRLATLGWSGFGFYHGWGEAGFALVARNFETNLLVPRRWPGTPFYHIPPLTPYGIYLVNQVLGESPFTARIPTLLAGAASAVGVHLTARRLRGRRVAALATPLYAVLPWTLLWAGRAKPDAHLLAGLTLGAAGIAWRREHRWALPLGMAALAYAGFAKQPAILFVVAAGLWLLFQDAPRRQRLRTAGRGAGWLLLAGLPLLAWAALQLTFRPDDFLFAVQDQASRGSFNNVTRSLVLGILGGATPPVLALAAVDLGRMDRVRDSLLTWWAATFLVFAVVKAPFAHEHYSWPAMAPLAIMAAAGLRPTTTWLARRLPGDRPSWNQVAYPLLLAAVVLAATLMLGYAGDLGNHNEARAAEAVTAYVDDHPTNRTAVLVDNQMSNQIGYYVPDLTYQPNRTDPVAGYTYRPPIDPAAIANRTQGIPHVLLVTWNVGDLPPEAQGRPVLEDTRYTFLTQDQRMRVIEWR